MTDQVAMTANVIDVEAWHYKLGNALFETPLVTHGLIWLGAVVVFALLAALVIRFQKAVAATAEKLAADPQLGNDLDMVKLLLQPPFFYQVQRYIFFVLGIFLIVAFVCTTWLGFLTTLIVAPLVVSFFTKLIMPKESARCWLAVLQRDVDTRRAKAASDGQTEQETKLVRLSGQLQELRNSP